MPLIELKLRQGIFRNGTKYEAKGQWYDCNLIRFLEKTKRPVGGWEIVQQGSTPVDVIFAATGVLTLTGQPLNTETVVIDTKTYTFQTTLTDVDGNVQIGGDAATSLANLVAAINLDAGAGTKYAASMTVHPTVSALVNRGTGDLMTVTYKTAASGEGTATTETLTNGSWDAATMAANVPRKLLAWRENSASVPQLAIGSNRHIHYFSQGALLDLTPDDLTVGAADSFTSRSNYGAGAYGVYNYSEGDPAQETLTEAGSWQLDTFGDHLVGVHISDGRLMFWDQGTSGDVMQVAAGAPTQNLGVVVTPERFLVCLGADGDPRYLKWATQETYDTTLHGAGVWTPVSTNSAGDWTLPGAGSIMMGIRGRNETMILTDKDLFAMQFIGGTLVYSIVQTGSECGVISRHGGAFVDGKLIWMGQRGFFKYDGYVTPIESSVSDYVFKDMSRTQRAKVWCLPLTDFKEIWWFYPSGNSEEPDRYVIYNYAEEHWTIGTLTRSCGVDRSAFEYPMVASPSYLYDHERGSTHDGGGTPFLESGPIEVSRGDNVMNIDRIVPDESTLIGQLVGSTQAYLYTSLYPTATETQNGPYTMATPTDIRPPEARQVRLRLEEIVAGDWRVGTVRINAERGGMR